MWPSSKLKIIKSGLTGTAQQMQRKMSLKQCPRKVNVNVLVETENASITSLKNTVKAN